jgi:hypothetical protein
VPPLSDRPIVTFDLDGVLCRPPLGINPGRNMTKDRAKAGARGLLWRTERVRYVGRRPMLGAREGFLLLSETYDCRVLSARSEEARDLTASWFRRWFGALPELNLRPDWRESPAAFKTRRVVELGAVAHFEDDPHTAAWLAELLPAVFLVDWWRNRWLSGIPNLHRIEAISDAAAELAEVSGARAGVAGV